METLTGLFAKVSSPEGDDHIGEPSYEEDDGYNRSMWDQWHPKLQPTIHRGIGVVIPPHHPANNLKLPVAERARALLEHVTRSPWATRDGLGMHWTDDPAYVIHHANSRTMPGETPVILHAKTPPRHHVEDNGWVLEDRAVRDWDGEEREVPVKRNAPLEITGITWGHGRRWKVHHDFDEPITKRAGRPKYTEDLADEGPVDLPYYRNTIPAPKRTNHYHGQDIEPHGQYFSRGELPESQRQHPMEWGTKSFKRPLRLYSPTDDPSHPDHWKQQLSRRYNGKKGKALSRAVAKDGYDAILTHDDYGPSESVDLSGFSTTAAYKHDHEWLPNGRYWGPNSPQNDQRLFDGDKLRPEVREDILRRVGKFFDGNGYRNWIKWTRVYFAGSEAAKWAPFNGDFDVLIGIDWPRFRQENPQHRGESDLQVATTMTDGLWKQANVKDYYFTLADGRKVGPFDRTFFVNAQAWDISKLHPYAAYDVTEDTWAVSPLKVPDDWSAEKLPESYWDYAEAVAKEIQAIGKLPPEERGRMARNLWEEIHTHRSDAFADGGKGIFDLSNVIEKYLDQHPKKLWDKLRDWKRGAPVPGVASMASLTSIFREAAVRNLDKESDPTGADYQGVMVALVPPRRICEALAVEGGEQVEAMHITLAYLGGQDEHEHEDLAMLPDLVKSWAATQKPLTAHVGGVGTFVNPTQHVLWAAVDLPHGTVFRDSLVHLLEEHGYAIRHDHGWTPHITLQYGKNHFRFLPKVEPATWDVDEVWVCVGGRWESFPIGG